MVCLQPMTSLSLELMSKMLYTPIDTKGWWRLKMASFKSTLKDGKRLSNCISLVHRAFEKKMIEVMRSVWEERSEVFDNKRSCDLHGWQVEDQGQWCGTEFASLMGCMWVDCLQNWTWSFACAILSVRHVSTCMCSSDCAFASQTENHVQDRNPLCIVQILSCATLDWQFLWDKFKLLCIAETWCPKDLFMRIVGQQIINFKSVQNSQKRQALVVLAFLDFGICVRCQVAIWCWSGRFCTFRHVCIMSHSSLRLCQVLDCSISSLQYGVGFEFCVDRVGFVNLDLSALYQLCISPWSYSHFSISAFDHGVRLQIGFGQVAFVHSDVSASCRICHSVSVMLASLVLDCSVWCQLRILRRPSRICEFCFVCTFSNLHFAFCRTRISRLRHLCTVSGCILDLFNSHLYISKSLHRVAFEDPPPSDLSTAAGKRCWSLCTMAWTFSDFVLMALSFVMPIISKLVVIRNLTSGVVLCDASLFFELCWLELFWISGFCLAEFVDNWLPRATWETW